MTAICPTCGCSLVRLGIDPRTAPAYEHRGERLLFCCTGCVDLFKEEPLARLEG